MGTGARGASKWRARLVALLVGTLLTALVVEGGLWIAHAVVRPGDRLDDFAPEPGTRHLLCIGDSFTYGSHVSPEDSYPGRLQALLDRVPGQAWRVVNLAYPGQNSAETRLRLARNIEYYRPELVVCLSGANTSWSAAAGHLWDHPHDEPEAKAGEAWWRKSRTLDLLRLVARREQTASEEEYLTEELARDAGRMPRAGGLERGGGIDTVRNTFPDGSITPRRAVVDERIRIDLARMNEICEQHGARLVLANYPVSLVGTQLTINAYIERYARDAGVPFVDLAARIVPLGEELGQSAVWFTDHHCTEIGNYEVARSVLGGLMDAGLLEEREAWRAVEPAEEVFGSLGLFVLDRDGDGVRVRLKGEPESTCRIYLRAWLLLEGGAPLAWTVPLTRAGLEPLEARSYFCVLDGEGSALVDLRLPRPEALGGLDELGDETFPEGARVARWELVPHFLAPGAPEEDSRAAPGSFLAADGDR